MIETILMILGFLLLILGLCELIHIITLAVISRGKDLGITAIVNLKPEIYFSQLVHANEQHKWQGEDFAAEIIAVSDELSDEELTEAQRYCETAGIILCKREDLYRILG